MSTTACPTGSVGVKPVHMNINLKRFLAKIKRVGLVEVAILANKIHMTDFILIDKVHKQEPQHKYGYVSHNHTYI